MGQGINNGMFVVVCVSILDMIQFMYHVVQWVIQTDLTRGIQLFQSHDLQHTHVPKVDLVTLYISVVVSKYCQLWGKFWISRSIMSY